MSTQKVQSYTERSRVFLTQAYEELGAGDLEQASEKGWGAASLMVKAVAEKRGLRHRRHGFLYEVVEALVEERGDEELDSLFDSANSLHFNFYEGEFGTRAVRRRLRNVQRFVDRMSAILDSYAV